MSSAGDSDSKGQPPPLPVTGRGGAPRLVSVPAPEVGDPFAVGVDPRPPRGGTPDEKVEYFRALVKVRDETLARARSLYGALEAELSPLRASASGLRSQVETLTRQLTAAQAEAARIPALLERIEATRQESLRQEKLAARVPELESRLKEALRGTARLQAELAPLKEELQAKSAQLESVTSDARHSHQRLQSAQAKILQLDGELDAIQERHRGVVSENELLAARLEPLERELQDARDATADAQHFQNEARTLGARCRALEEELTEAVRKANALESEQEWAKSTLEAARDRAQALEEEKTLLLGRMEAEFASFTLRLQEAERNEQSVRAELAEERGRVEALETVLEGEREQTDALKGRLEELENTLETVARAKRKLTALEALLKGI